MTAAISALAAILVIYAASSIKKQITSSKRIKARVEKDRKIRSINSMTEIYIKNIGRYLSKDGPGTCLEAIIEMLAKKGVTNTLTRKDIKDLLNDIARQYATPKLYAPITEKNGALLIDFVYETLQITFKTGPAYKKFEKTLNKKMSSVSSKDIQNYLQKNYKGEITSQMINQIKKNLASGTANRISEGYQAQMQNRIQNDMQNQMQMQMQTDMQNQMQLQMQTDMQNQMQMQMMMDMQNQMQMQMMMDMQNQMQMQMMNDMQQQMQQAQMDLANTMHQSEMAITPMHDGGFMNDMNNMHMGGM